MNVFLGCKSLAMFCSVIYNTEHEIRWGTEASMFCTFQAGKIRTCCVAGWHTSMAPCFEHYHLLWLFEVHHLINFTLLSFLSIWSLVPKAWTTLHSPKYSFSQLQLDWLQWLSFHLISKKRHTLKLMRKKSKGCKFETKPVKQQLLNLKEEEKRLLWPS